MIGELPSSETLLSINSQDNGVLPNNNIVTTIHHRSTRGVCKYTTRDSVLSRLVK